MKRTPTFPRRRSRSGFTLVELLMAMTISVVAMTLALGTFMSGVRLMYKDSERLATNHTLRAFTAQVARETLDATEFYVFPSYESLDGSVNLTADVSVLQADTYGTFLALGDCLVLVTRVSTDTTSNIRHFRIYYRTATDPNAISSIRYYESYDYGSTGTTTSLAALLNGIDLEATPNFSGSRELVPKARGRLLSGSPTDCHPIFATESPTTSPTNDSVSINVEIINGTKANHMLSSSSFNYTISPRK